MNKIIRIFDINFIDADFNKIKSLLDKGGLLVLPAGPALATIKSDIQYYKSIKNADLVLFDSGYLCLLLRFLKKIKVKKISGYLFLKKFIQCLKRENKEKIFLIDPSHNQSKINKHYLKSQKINKIHQYIAPIYKKNKIFDEQLLDNINKIKPKYILINLGGGTQEVLGNYLKKKLNYKPSIICSGAAISFLTKQQAPLTDFIDKVYAGWLLRIIFDPFNFLPRYLFAFKLFFLVHEVKNIKQSKL
jgi:N-acetylglucosaminyldiphosphoundecaprenol N-acetyl-beta-D-mannosaminyltransferase